MQPVVLLPARCCWQKHRSHEPGPLHGRARDTSTNHPCAGGAPGRCGPVHLELSLSGLPLPSSGTAQYIQMYSTLLCDVQHELQAAGRRCMGAGVREWVVRLWLWRAA